jgi:hypothetical protein
MALTERLVLTDNTAGPFAIGFNYLQGHTIKVYLLDALGSNPIAQEFSFTGTSSLEQPEGTAILLDVPILVGGSLRIVKEIDMDSPVVTWSESAELSKQNLRDCSINLMEQAQTAYDIAKQAYAFVANNAVNITALQVDVTAVLVSTAQAVINAQYYADLAQAGALVANPSGVALAARDAALVAQLAAEAARDSAITNRNTAVSSAATAATQAAAALVSANAAEAARVAMDAAILAGSLKWNGSSKFVSTLDPNPSLGVNGDFWFKREV